MEITRIPLDLLELDPFNARAHPDRNMDAVRKSLEAFGQVEPLVVQERTSVVVGGNARLQAMRALGWKEADCVLVDLSDEEAKALGIALNRTAELATWNHDNLATMLDELSHTPLFDVVAFDQKALADTLSQLKTVTVSEHLRSLAGELKVEEDETPALPKTPVTKLGDVWVLGRHRLKCGDATVPEDVAEALGEVEPFVMITDPPYGVLLDQSWRDGALKKHNGNANRIPNDDRADWTKAWELFRGDVAYVWHASRFADVVMDSLRKAEFEICQQLIWNKSVMVLGRNDYHFKHEPCWYAVRKGRTHGWVGDRTQTTVIDAASPNMTNSSSTEEQTEHPTQKPVACMAYPMKNPAGAVYDPFLGSGTTIVAAEQLERQCVGLELSPAYCDVIIERWQNLTGAKATRG